MTDSLPELNKFNEENSDKRDKFEIIALHDNSAKDFADLDQKLGDAKRDYWGGKDIAFPMLIDAEGKTFPVWEVIGAPTYVLIDPNGRLAKGANLRTLSEKIK